MQVSMSMRLPKELNDDLTNLAAATGRTKSYLATEAIKEFVNSQSWQIAKIEKGLEEAKQGLFASDEEIEELHKKWGYNADKVD